MGVRDVLAQNLRRIRAEKGISQEGLAYAAKIDRTYISSIERGIYAASIDVIGRLAKGLGVTAADLLTVPPKGRKKS